MILCVTLNPCLDKTLTVPSWSPGDNVRGTSVEEVVGGKGNNVARALKRLGHDDVRSVTFLGGEVGQRCDRLLREQDGFESLITWCGSNTRIILTVRTGSATPATAFFDPDPVISAAEAMLLHEQVRTVLKTGGVRLIALCGSSPARTTDELYATLVQDARAASVPVLLDTYGAPLGKINAELPDAIHLNRVEATAHCRPSPPTDEVLASQLRLWASQGVRFAIITDGPNPVLACLAGRLVRATPPVIQEVNPVGSGDCLLAGLADAWLRHCPLEESLRFSLAAGAANAATWTAGAIRRDQVEALMPGVRVESL